MYSKKISLFVPLLPTPSQANLISNFLYTLPTPLIQHLVERGAIQSTDRSDTLNWHALPEPMLRLIESKLSLPVAPSIEACRTSILQTLSSVKAHLSDQCFTAIDYRFIDAMPDTTPTYGGLNPAFPDPDEAARVELTLGKINQKILAESASSTASPERKQVLAHLLKRVNQLVWFCIDRLQSHPGDESVSETRAIVFELQKCDGHCADRMMDVAKHGVMMAHKWQSESKGALTLDALITYESLSLRHAVMVDVLNEVFTSDNVHWGAYVAESLPELGLSALMAHAHDEHLDVATRQRIDSKIDAFKNRFVSVYGQAFVPSISEWIRAHSVPRERLIDAVSQGILAQLQAQFPDESHDALDDRLQAQLFDRLFDTDGKINPAYLYDHLKASGYFSEVDFTLNGFSQSDLFDLESPEWLGLFVAYSDPSWSVDSWIALAEHAIQRGGSQEDLQAILTLIPDLALTEDPVKRLLKKAIASQNQSAMAYLIDFSADYLSTYTDWVIQQSSRDFFALVLEKCPQFVDYRAASTNRNVLAFSFIEKKEFIVEALPVDVLQRQLFEADPLNARTVFQICIEKNCFRALDVIMKRVNPLVLRDLMDTPNPNTSNYTALHFAGIFGATDCLVRLLDAGATWTYLGDNGYSIAHSAAANNQLSCLSVIIQRCPDLVSMNTLAGTPLHIAVNKGHVACVERLIQGGAAIDAQYLGIHENNTPLACAVKIGDLRIAAALLNHGASLTVPDVNGFTPVHMAVWFGKFDFLTLFLTHDPSVLGINSGPGSLLHVAIRKDDPDLLRQLLQLGVDPTIKNAAGYPVPHYAVQMGRVDSLSVIHAADPNLLSLDVVGVGSPLRVAIQADHVACFDELLKLGANPRALDDKGYTAAHLAAFYNKPTMLRRLGQLDMGLLSAQTNVDTPLVISVQGGYIESVDVLLTTSVNIDVVIKHEGNTPLHIAAKKGRVDIFSRLLQAGANPNIPDVNGYYVSHLAAFFNHVGILEVIQKQAPSLLFKSSAPGTPLQVATQKNHAAIVAFYQPLQSQRTVIEALSLQQARRPHPSTQTPTTPSTPSPTHGSASSEPTLSPATRLMGIVAVMVVLAAMIALRVSDGKRARDMDPVLPDDPNQVTVPFYVPRGIDFVCDVLECIAMSKKNSPA